MNDARSLWAEAVLEATLKQQAESGELSRIRHTIQITSFGGCGTTALYDHVAAAGLDVPETIGQFPFKHQRIPPDSEQVPASFRVVYICGDPRNAVLSVLRRHGAAWYYRVMRLEDPPPEAMRRLSSLESFLAAGIDDFRIEDHLERWLARKPSGYPVLCVRYETLHQVWQRVADFIGLPSGYPSLPLKRRNSDWRTLPHDARMQLDRMYGPLARRIFALPAAQII
jgi:hypothetical protein